MMQLWFRDALKYKGIKPRIPGRKSPEKPIRDDRRRYRRCNRLEITSNRPVSTALDFVDQAASCWAEGNGAQFQGKSSSIRLIL